MPVYTHPDIYTCAFTCKSTFTSLSHLQTTLTNPGKTVSAMVAPRPAVNGTPYRSRGRVGVRFGVRVRVAVRVGIRVGGKIMFPAGVRYGFMARVSVVGLGMC